MSTQLMQPYEFMLTAGEKHRVIFAGRQITIVQGTDLKVEFLDQQDTIIGVGYPMNIGDSGGVDSQDEKFKGAFISSETGQAVKLIATSGDFDLARFLGTVEMLPIDSYLSGVAFPCTGVMSEEGIAANANRRGLSIVAAPGNAGNVQIYCPVADATAALETDKGQPLQPGQPLDVDGNFAMMVSGAVGDKLHFVELF